MKTIKYILLFSLIAICFSCEDFLDKEYDSTLSEEKVFTDERLSRQFLFNIYGRLPDVFAYIAENHSMDCLTDNAYPRWAQGPMRIFVDASFNVNNNPYAYHWGDNYKYIRSANKFLENTERFNTPISDREIPGSDENRLLTRYRAEARLLRAIFHFQLVSFFGDIPIVDKVLELDELQKPRDKAVDVLHWIANECDEVTKDLPYVYQDAGNWGKVSGAVAQALKIKALLYASSPLYNENAGTADWKRTADTAWEFIEKNKSTGYFKLEQGYDTLFFKPFAQEVILARSIWNQHTIELKAMPTGFNGCGGLTNVSQNLVDAYETIKGLPINEDPDYDPQNPYVNRDPRLGLSVFHNGSYWAGRDIETFNGGRDLASQSSTVTGYYMRKWCHPDFNPADRKDFPRNGVIYRYGEILLTYAEARNEASGPDDTVYDAINQVRKRAGMPGLPKGLTQAQMKERIRNERRVELAFEDHRYFDIRRWKIYGDNQTTSVPIYKVTIIKENDQLQFTYGTAENRPWYDKLYFMPIPYSETQKNKALTQNPGWETTLVETE